MQLAPGRVAACEPRGSILPQEEQILMRIATRALGDEIHDREALRQRAAYIALRMVGPADVAARLIRSLHHELGRLEPMLLLGGEITKIALAVGREEQMRPRSEDASQLTDPGELERLRQVVKTERAYTRSNCPSP